MKSIRVVLFKSLVKSFYQANAGFFLVVVFLGFGFLKTPQHLDIAIALAYHPSYYLFVLVPWLMYALKTLQFARNEKRLPSYQFLSYVSMVPKPQRLRLVMAVQAALLAPILLYSSMLVVVAVQQAQWLSLSYLVLGNLVILFIASRQLDRLIIQPVDPKEVGSLAKWTGKLPRSYSWLFIHHLFNRQAVVLLGTKVISLAVLGGFIMIYEVESTDLRLVSLGLLLSAGINSILSFHYRQFEQKDLKLFRNLPLSPDARFVKVILTFTLLSLPEILVLYLNGVMAIPLLFLLKNALLPISLLCFYHALCYVRPVNAEQFVKLPFFSVAILFFVILGHVDVLYLSTTLMLLSWLLYRLRFTAFEWA